MKGISIPRPLVPVAFVFALGIFLDKIISPPFAWGLAVCSAAAAAFAMAFVARRVDSAACSIVIYILVAAAGGLIHNVEYQYIAFDDVYHLAGEDPAPVAVRGTVVCEPWYGKFGRATYDFAIDEIKSGSEWTPVSGTVRVRQYDGPVDIPYGTRMELAGMLRLPRGPTGPGQFDYREYLRRNGVRTLMSVSGAEHARVIGGRGFHPVRRLAHHMRRKMKMVIDTNFPADEGAILDAMLIGNRSMMTRSTVESFAASGTTHFLAISGLHVGIIAGVIWWLLKYLGISRKWKSVLVMAAVILYAYVAGGRPPVVRAAVMTVAFCFAMIIDREADMLNIVAAAALALLVVHPSNLFDAGFQLSFAAVFSIVGLMPVIGIFREWSKQNGDGGRIPPAVKKYVLAAIAVSICAWLGVAPLVAKYFHLVTPVVILVSPVLLPLVGAILVGGMLSVAVASVSSVLASPIVYLTTVLLTLLQKIVAAAGVVPLSHWYVSVMPLVPVYYVILAVLIMVNLPRRVKVSAMCLLGVWSIFSGLLWSPLSPVRADTVTMLDVGKGNCVVVTARDGSTVVYDIGSTSFRSVGERQLAPLLWGRGIRRIDALILSHPQADHVSGVREIIRRFLVEKVIVSSHFGRFEIGERVLRLLDESGVDVTVVTGPEILKFGAVECEILWPRSGVGDISPNDSSLVVKLTNGGIRVLLTGDIEEHAVRELLRDGINPACDILQVPHHGRMMSFSEEFATAAHPSIALMSDAYGDLAGKSRVMYEGLGSEIYTTWRSGTITIDCGTMEVSEWLRRD